MATKIVVNGQEKGVIAFKGDTEPCAVYIDGVRQDNMSYTPEPIEGENSVEYKSEYKKNIRTMQIEGNTFQQTYSGKNLFDENNIIKGYSTGSIDTITPSNAYRIVKIDNLKAGTYTISFSTPFYLIRQWIDGQMKQDLGTVNTTYTFTTTTDNTYGICFRKSDSSEIIEDFTVQVEKGSTATDYEPYVGGMASPNAGSSTGTPASPVIDTIDSYKDSNYLANEWVAGCITPIELPEQGKTYRVWVDEAQFQAQASTFAYLEIYIGTSFEQVTSGSDSNGSSKQLAFNQYGQCTFNTVEMSENFYIGIGNTYEGISGHETTCWEALKNISVYIQTEPYESTLVEIPAYPQPIHNANDTRLPSEYQEVEYIESTGTQFIDTKFIPNQDTRVVCDFQLTETYASFVFGAREASGVDNPRYYTFNMSSGGQFVTTYNAITTSLFAWDLSRHIVDKNKNVTTLDDSSRTVGYETFTSPKTLTLFACNQTNSYGYLPSKMKLYSCQMYDNGTLIRDFVPCYRISDNKVGMYDLVNGEFYGNNGTGEFVKGANIGALSLELRGKNLCDLEYLVNNATATGLDYEWNSVKLYVGKGNRVTAFINEKLPTGLSFYLCVAYKEGASGVNDSATKWLYYTSVASRCNRMQSFISTEDYIYVTYYKYYKNQMLANVKYLQVEIGEETPYEPHFEPVIVKIPPSVTVEGTEIPLRFAKINSPYGDYIDKIVIDRTKGTVEYRQNTGLYTYTGNESFSKGSYTVSSNYNRYWSETPTMNISIATGRGRGYCTHFKWSDYATMGVAFGLNNTYISFIVNNTTFPTVTDFKNWLKTQADNGNPVSVVYPLKETITVLYDKSNNITTDLGQALLNLANSTQNATNIITITSTPSVSKLSVNYAKWGGAK